MPLATSGWARFCNSQADKSLVSSGCDSRESADQLRLQRFLRLSEETEGTATDAGDVCCLSQVSQSLAGQLASRARPGFQSKSKSQPRSSQVKPKSNRKSSKNRESNQNQKVSQVNLSQTKSQVKVKSKSSQSIWSGLVTSWSLLIS